MIEMHIEDETSHRKQQAALESQPTQDDDDDYYYYYGINISMHTMLGMFAILR